MLYPNVEYYGLRFATVNGISDNLRTDIMINAMVENAIKEKAVNLFNGKIRRPILYINDLCRAIEAVIQHDADDRGVYNLSSFNGTAESIAVGVSDALGVELKRVDQKQVEAAINSKLPTAYDFSISPEKFCKTFNFKFEGDIGTIVKNVSDHIEGIHTGKRLVAVRYR
jgi:nucleoside-diphosphate-sugar epimerase